MGRPIEQKYSRSQRPAPGAFPETQRSARCHGTTRSARWSRLPGDVSRRSRATEIANGGFATTRKGRRGSRMSPPSARTTTTLSWANARRSSCARAGCSSKAMTRAPRRRSGAVMAPEPAPISSTRSPRRTPASSTSRSAHRLSSRCHPQWVRGSGTADHRAHCHGTTVGDRCARVNELRMARRLVRALASWIRKRDR